MILNGRDEPKFIIVCQVGFPEIIGSLNIQDFGSSVKRLFPSFVLILIFPDFQSYSNPENIYPLIITNLIINMEIVDTSNLLTILFE